MPVTIDDYRTAFRRQRHDLVAVVRARDHDVCVTHLPTWAVHDVLAHVAGDYAWALDIMRRRSTAGSVLGRSDAAGAALVDEIEALGSDLDDLFAEVDPDEPCPNFTGEGTMRFWFRRQAHETTIHRWDVDDGRDVRSIDDRLAIDGIDEVFEVYATRWPGHDVSAGLTIGCPGAGTAWRVSPVGSEGRIDVVRVSDVSGVDLQAEPAELLLLLWGRLPVAGGHVADPNRADAVAAFLRGPLTA